MNRYRNSGMLDSFNSRTREGCDPWVSRIGFRAMFQFTHPRGVRSARVVASADRSVSIHAPARGAMRRRSASSSCRCFNSRTREGCDKNSFPSCARVKFQFTHPRGVRFAPVRDVWAGCVSIHAPARGAIFTSACTMRANSFNSRTREGCDSTAYLL